ncbi:TniQ family protein [Hydrogenophaga sp.]|uniref:TniQ family protein n=1 Tax=Hydrogenophaga sp. TaxID=1904254 RepID=UPI002733483E|nr:TniQ family protein [Hydrogenophaga sp.]MDP3883665.1 TniQ family protein [Hydrogenophaga sp.]
MDPRELTFPFQSEVRPGESGQGYALRMAAENHLNGLPQLKILLGKSRFATLDAVDSPLLHRWFGADERSLDHVLGWIHTGKRSEEYVYAGHTLGRSYFLNRSYPRVCFKCLQAEGHCKTAWDFSLAVACAKHGELLADTCPHCHRSITWHRPTPGTCSCHLEFSAACDPALASALEAQFATWIDQQIEKKTRVRDQDELLPSSTTEAPAGLTPLMQLVWPLSLNGGLCLTFALATAAGYDEKCSCDGLRPRAPLKKAQRILLNAAQFAQKIQLQDEMHLRVQRPSVVVQLLADCISGDKPPADRNLAQSLLISFLRIRSKARWSGTNPQLSQLHLF